MKKIENSEVMNAGMFLFLVVVGGLAFLDVVAPIKVIAFGVVYMAGQLFMMQSTASRWWMHEENSRRVHDWMEGRFRSRYNGQHE